MSNDVGMAILPPESLGDYMQRLFIGAIAFTFTWLVAHQKFRDLIPRYVFPLVVVFCFLYLVHLPRLPWSWLTVKEMCLSPLVMHFPSEWEVAIPASEVHQGF